MHCVADDPDVLARSVMNFDVMAHFQAGEQRTMDLATGLVAATCPVLVLTGELDPLCPVEMSDEIVEALARRLSFGLSGSCARSA